MKVLVTGSSGFLGQHLLRVLEREGHRGAALPSVICDLRDVDEARETFLAVKPDVLIHAAAVVAGVAYNLEHQADMLYENCLLNLQTFEAARQAKVPRIISISSACAYPAEPVYPYEAFVEDDLWEGPPDQSVIGYGMAKRLQILQGELYERQYGMLIQSLVLPNMYGPGDHFDDRSHVVSALIKRFVEAKEIDAPYVIVWGTGKAIREMLYVEDAAIAIVQILDSVTRWRGPLNVGTSVAVSVREIAETIARVVGYTGTIAFDDSKPEGPLVKRMDHRLCIDLFPSFSHTLFEDGIEKAVKYYMDYRSLVA